MMAALLLVAASLASYGGFACLALAMPDHWTRVSGQRSDAVPRPRVLRSAGFSMLGMAYVLCMYRDGPSFGSLLWVVQLSVAAIAVALTLTWRPKFLLMMVWRSPTKPRK